jgi:hypothetical protein
MSLLAAEPLALPETAPPSEKPRVLIGMSLPELRDMVKAMGEPSFRADQLHHWIYVKCFRDWELMTNLKRSFRDTISERYQIGSLKNGVPMPFASVPRWAVR